MTKEQLIQIAKVGFTNNYLKQLNFENLEMNHFSGVYRLYDKGTQFMFMLPEKEHLAIFINKDIGWVQIEPYSIGFNHYAALKEMERMKLI